MIKFYDTSALLEQIPNEYFYISTITLIELENIKTAYNKDYEVKQKARHVSNWLSEHIDSFRAIRFNPATPEERQMTNDEKILTSACGLAKRMPLTFYTNDNNLFLYATSIGLNVEKIKVNQDKQNGVHEISLNDIEMAQFYENLNNNIFNLYRNQYLIVKNTDNEIVDIRCWDGKEYRILKNYPFSSIYFGEVKPIKNDAYQKIAFDSLINNQLTVLRGPSGSGKSYIGLGFLFSLLELGKIDKIIMFVNPMAERNSCRFGFLPGSLIEKILGSQIGNFLASKLGNIEAVYRLIEEHKLEFIATADARGYDTSGMRCGIFMTEAQNSTIDMMKLILERFGEDSIGVLEGDTECQVDHSSYENGNNGLKRVCEVYKGEPYFGTVTLKNCYRSKIAKQALKM